MAPGLIALHIPDGFLAPGLSIVGWILSIALLWVAIRHTRVEFGEAQAPVMGVLAAFIFAAQAINFPVMAGTSGHLVGAALAGIVMGPWAGCLIMTAVIFVQGLIFQDGGLLVMGWNIFNMAAAVLAGFSAFKVSQLLLGENHRSRTISAFLAAWVSVEVAAIATALQLFLSGTFPLQLSLFAMAAIYAVVGLCEGLITAAAVSLLQVSRPEVLRDGQQTRGQSTAAVISVGMALAMAIVLFSPLASESPDGLEVVAESLGVASEDPLLTIFPDYSVLFLGETFYSTILAMVTGTLLVFGLAAIVGRFSVSRAEE